MDIQQAKQQIKYTMQAYFAKDEFGGYALPPAAPAPHLPAGRARHRQNRHRRADRPRA